MPVTRRIRSHPDFKIPPEGRAVTFTLDGKPVTGQEGDTITSALLAAGVTVLSRSFKYHRPRGVYDFQGRGAETLVTVDGAPNVLADCTAIREGMAVARQNAWPSVNFDLMAVNNLVVPLLPNAFYYKMFHKPRWLWPIVEKFIRRAAGIGKIDTSGRGVETRYEKRYRFPDVCVVGAGPAGLAAARAALEAGRRVLLVDENLRLGGHALHTLAKVNDCPDPALNGLPAWEAIQCLVESVRGRDRLEILTDATVTAVYEDNLISITKGNDLFKVRADSVVLAPGAGDRHLVFENNDTPGIMTARGVERLIALHGVRPGTCAVVVTTHDGGYHTAAVLHGAGVEVAALTDTRTSPVGDEFVRRIQGLNIPVYREQIIHAAIGYKSVRRAEIGPLGGAGSSIGIPCDLIVLAVGYMPHLNLPATGHSRPQWDRDRQILRAGSLPAGLYVAGEVNGHAPFARLYREGWEAGTAAANGDPQPESVRDESDRIAAPPADVERGGRCHFICKCMDVTRAEAQVSIDEGFDQVETLKRYTSMGMGPCQGKTCHEAVARLAAQDTGQDPDDPIPTNSRPPFVPVRFGVLAGRAPHLGPVRRTSMHACHERLDARFLDAGQWKRPEDYGDARKEALNVRNGLGLIDVSTLGKMEVSGPDAIPFLHFMLPGQFAKLAVGRTRYSIMVGEDGIMFEDGTISQVAEGRYYISTTTGNSDAIDALWWWWLTTEDFDVQFKNLTHALSAVNVAGPKSRALMEKIVDIDMSNEAFPYMACRQASLAGVKVLLFRIGFTGELGYEIHFPSEYGPSMWDYLMEKGAACDMKPFGVESQRILRLEKGHLIPGMDTDALSNPYEAGVSFTVRPKKKNFVGKAFLRQFKTRGIEERLVPYRLAPGGPIPDDGVAILRDGRIIGRVTSSRLSPTLGCGIGLCWVKSDFAEAGNRIAIRLADGRDVVGEVIEHAAYDPDGERVRS